MTDPQMTATQTNGLEMRWTPAVDATGRSYMQAQWVVVGEPQTVLVHHAA